MADTFLQLVNDALGSMGIPQFTSVIGNVDPTAVQCLALMNELGNDLLEEDGGWPQLEGVETIPLIAGQEAYDFPTDFDFYLDGGAWDAAHRWRAVNTSAREWMTLQYGLIATGPWVRFRLLDGKIHFNPVPADTGTIALAYYRNGFCQAAGGATQQRWAADTDIALLPSRLFTLGLKWKLLAAKGMNYAEERDRYDKSVATKKARSTGSNILDLNRRGPRFVSFGDPMIPPGDWPAS